MDTGCPYTVSGDVWFKSYVSSLSRRDRLSIITKQSSKKFRFGDGELYKSQCHVTVPVYIGQARHHLGMDIVACNIPLLLSRETLQRAKAKLDIGAAEIIFLGVTLPLLITSTGHLCLSLSRSMDGQNDESEKLITRVLFSSPIINGIGADIKNKATKLHLQFCHPTADRLINLIKKAGYCDERIEDTIRAVTSQCEVCLRNRKPPLRPAVGFPLATEFNQTVALDLKCRGHDGYILHMIDHLTRYSSACLIKNKRKETIVQAILEYWIRIFGFPKNFLSDNGGEFANKQMVDLAEKYNIILKTTAAESPWSNGLCERHNGILNNNVNKIMSSGNFSLECAVHWAVAAKNSLANVYGFSPNMLVFGRNPNFPTAFNNKPPANNLTCLSEYVAENLNAMHVAREVFIQQECAERLRRALNKKSRAYANNIFCEGDQVYYWRTNQSECHGPATVIGRDAQQILVKHGGLYIRVHPCRLQLCNQEAQETAEKAAHSDDREEATPVDNNDDYVTADEGDDPEDSFQLPDASFSTSHDNDEIDIPDIITTGEDWVNVVSKRNLPNVNTMIECKFPTLDHSIKCKVLSRAGKVSTANWHYLNILEENATNGKCCSFKNVSWRPIPEHVDDEPSSQETFYATHDPSFDIPKKEEIEKWKYFQTFEEVPDNGERAITTRWVCTRKIKGDKIVAKARLVARGFEEDSKSFKKDSPTCSKESLRIALTIFSSYAWRLHSLDVKSAFLQGLPMERTVYLRPPKEAKSEFLWKMLRCPYGLSDAGRHWYLRLKEKLTQLEMVPCKYDQALFTWFCDGSFAGLLVCHLRRKAT